MAGGGRPRRFDYAAIRQMYLQDGVTGTDVAQHFGCSKTMVYEIVQDIKKPAVNVEAWPEDVKEKLRELWGTMPTKQVAHVLGRGRNALIGQAHRMGLRKLKPGTVTPKPKAERPPKEKRVNGGAVRIARLARFDDNKRSARKGSSEFLFGAKKKAHLAGAYNRELFRQVPLPFVDLDHSRKSSPECSVTLYDLKFNQCAWIVGAIKGAETPCCGLPVDPGSGRPFCAEHRQRAKAKIQLVAA